MIELGKQLAISITNKHYVEKDKMISQRLKALIKLNEQKNYEIAHKAGLHPSTFSKIRQNQWTFFPNSQTRHSYQNRLMTLIQ